MEFAGSRAVQSQQLLVADDSLLTGGVDVEVTDTVAAAPRIVRIALPGPSGSNSAVGGTFRLSFDNGVTVESTVPIPADASSEAVQLALADLPSIGLGNVGVTIVPTGPGQSRAWDLELTGLTAADGQPLLVSNASGLTGGIDVVVTPTPATAINEVQRIPSPYAVGARGGTFRLTVNNGLISRTTGDIPFDATVAEIQLVLEQLASVGGPTNLRVEGVTRGPWDAMFVGALSGTDLPLMMLDGSNLVRPADPAIIAEDVPGAAGVDEVQSITLDPLAFEGDFRLAFLGESTAALAYNATAAQVQAALAALPTVGVGNVVVSGPAGGPWSVQFVGARQYGRGRFDGRRIGPDRARQHAAGTRNGTRSQWIQRDPADRLFTVGGKRRFHLDV